MKLAKPITTALICAILIGTNAWLAALSWRDDAFMVWSSDVRLVVKVNIAAHILMAASALAGLVMVKFLWGAVAGALLKAVITVWVVSYMGGVQFTAGSWGLVAFWVCLAAAIALLIRWNYSTTEEQEIVHPEREFV